MSLYPSLNNNSLSKTPNNNILFPARVKEILLSTDSPLFSSLNGWADLGTIKFQPLYKSIEFNNTLTAKPLFSNIKNYPIKEEIILIIMGPSANLNDNPNSKEYYYLPFPVNIWNSNHHNSIPDIDNYNNNPRELNFGKTFKELDNIRNILPEEGDVILEGRFGNSIRLSSTSSKKNPWSNKGNNGDPIIIIRNGQYKTEGNPWNPSYEDINNDGSSIYLTNNQEIPLELACKNLKSFNITISNSFNSSLIIPDVNNV